MLAGKVKHAVFAVWLVAICSHALATTKGLNQIVTPDIQPMGVLSVSVQGENAALGNSRQLQLELGLTPSFEVALFRGFEPGESEFNAELNLVKHRSFLLSTGLLGVENRLKPQPFLEGGYYAGKWYLIGGIQRQDPNCVGVFGAAYQATPRVLITSDYVSGSDNLATAGVTLTLSPTLTFNPAVYIANSSPHRLFGYGVLSWNIKAW